MCRCVCVGVCVCVCALYLYINCLALTVRDTILSRKMSRVMDGKHETRSRRNRQGHENALNAMTGR